MIFNTNKVILIINFTYTNDYTMEDTNIVIDKSKLSFIKEILSKYDKEKNNIKQLKIKSDCAILKNAFEDLVNNDLPNGVNQIIKDNRIKGKSFDLQYISFNSELMNECSIDTKKISNQIQDITGKHNNIKLKSLNNTGYNLVMDFY